jgi:hypothetical protein
VTALTAVLQFGEYPLHLIVLRGDESLKVESIVRHAFYDARPSFKSILRLRCVGRPGGWGVFEMLMQMDVFLAVSLAANGGGFRMRDAEVRLPCAFRTGGERRKHLLKILFVTRRAFGHGRRVQHQQLEAMFAPAALIFEKRH